jgi:two-component system response regulator HydG
MQLRSNCEPGVRRPAVLIVDYETAVLDLCYDLASALDCHVRTAPTPDQALQIIARASIDVLFVDATFGGLRLIRTIHADHPDINIVALTPSGVPETAADAFREGAVDYLEKPFSADEFQEKLKQWQRIERPCANLQQLRERLANTVSPGGLVGNSKEMQTIHALIAKVNDRGFPVVILGESGTGKELVARAIHHSGPRSNAPFVPVDCSALTPSLIESQLFGYVRGAFTGAERDRKGLFEAAHKGTLLLDEIGELPKDLQPKLLRAIQEREVRPVGSTDALPLDVRIIVATNRDLTHAINEGRFRQDLYYRLNVFQIVVPPLRTRKSDIPLLVAAFLKKHADPNRPIIRVAKDFWTMAMAYDWPGNVRELDNIVQRCIILGTGEVLRYERDFSPTLGLANAHGEDAAAETLDTAEKRTILKALHQTNGDRLAATKILGIGKSTLYRKLKGYTR